VFVLAEGIEVAGAELQNGLLAIDLSRPRQEKTVRTIEIKCQATDEV
jgi:HSP20 family molecular chaperone IbpA